MGSSRSYAGRRSFIVVKGGDVAAAAAAAAAVVVVVNFCVFRSTCLVVEERLFSPHCLSAPISVVPGQGLCVSGD